jgi:hypothetical protein
MNGHTEDHGRGQDQRRESGRVAAKRTSKAHADRPVVVNFFASWCVPGKKETPLLARFSARRTPHDRRRCQRRHRRGPRASGSRQAGS